MDFYISNISRTIIYIWILIIGLLAGSFIYCYAYRQMNPEYKGRLRSCCDYCKHQLIFIDLIPLFSYMLTKGRCRYCDKKISIKYPLSELLTAFIYLIVYQRFYFWINRIHYFILFSALIAICFTDIEKYLIPDKMIILIIINKLLFTIYQHNNPFKMFLNGFLISFLILLISIIMKKISGKDTIGGGDIKLLFVLGTYFNFGINLYFILFSCIIGLIYLLFIGKYDKPFPFAPCICLSFFILIMFIY